MIFIGVIEVTSAVTKENIEDSMVPRFFGERR
jgi:hypothetical protein